MANKQFGVDFPAAGALTGTETLSIVQGGVTVDATTQNIANLAPASTPGGANTQVQFNDSATFGGDAGLVYNKTTDTLTGVNFTTTGLNLTAASTTSSAGLRLPHGAAPSAPTNGDTWTTTAGMFARINGATVGPFGAGGSGAMSLLGTATVAGAAATTLTLSGLDLSLYKSFFVLYRLDNATAGSANVSLLYNADAVLTNYWTQIGGWDGASSFSSRQNTGFFAQLDASQTATGFMYILNDLDGKPRAVGSNSRNTVGTAIYIFNVSHGWVTAANVTGITFSSSVASSLAIGSTFSVFGIN